MTIYALSTGPGISGVAIVRISGPETSEIIKLLTKRKIILQICDLVSKDFYAHKMHYVLNFKK